jgi:hypothetical protein
MAYKQPNSQTNNTPNIGPLQIFNQGENLKSGVWQKVKTSPFVIILAFQYFPFPPGRQEKKRQPISHKKTKAS